MRRLPILWEIVQVPAGKFLRPTLRRFGIHGRSFPSSFFGSAIAEPIVGPLINAITGPSCKPSDRSHSHALSRAGRPRFCKNPSASLIPESVTEAARDPFGIPGISLIDPVNEWTESINHFGRQSTRQCSRIVERVVFVKRIRFDAQLIRTAVANRAQQLTNVKPRIDEGPRQMVRAGPGSSAGYPRECHRSVRSIRRPVSIPKCD